MRYNKTAMNTVKYENIYNHLKKEIKEGLYKKGELLPTEKELCIKFNVSRIVVRMAVEKLVKFGFVEKKAGYGTFVTYDVKDNEFTTIGVVFSSLASSFGDEILLAIEHEASKNNYNIIFKNATSRESQKQCLNALFKANVKGIIMQPVHNETYCEELTHFIEKKIPIVLIDRDLPEMDFSFVGTDSILETKNAISRLFRLGIKNICMVSQDISSATTLQERKQGFLLAHKENFRNPLTDYLFSDIKSIAENTKDNYLLDKENVRNFLLKNKCDCVLALELGVAVIISEIISESNDELKNIVLVTYDRPEVKLLNCKYHIVQNQKDMGIEAFNLLLDQIKTKSKCIKKFLATDFINQ